MKLVRLLIAFIVALPVSYVATIKGMMLAAHWIAGPMPQEYPSFLTPVTLVAGAGSFLMMFYGIHKLLLKFT